MVFLMQVLCVSGSKLWEVPTAPLTPQTNLSMRLLWKPQCLAQLRHLQNEERITVTMPPKMEGHWVSSRCEVRPGPEFLTRFYTFYQSPTRLFRALQHYYSDSDCQIPAYSLVIRGKLQLRQASWITHGATEAEHHLHKVGMVIHSQKAIHNLATRLSFSCLGLKGGGHLVLHRFYELFNAKAEKDCMGALGFSMMELELLRVETHHHPHSRPAQELFLGDVHTDWNERVHHRPTGYQEPLQNAMHHIHPCPVCALVYRASEQHPPILPSYLSIPLDLNGRWVSQRCETRPAILFLTRLFFFNEDQHTWEGTYQHYSDPMCLQPSFTLLASGHYARAGQSIKVHGATELVFKVTRAKVAVFDRALIRELNSLQNGSCGQVGLWKVGAEQDITWTDGCNALGIRLPHKEYELFKTEKDHRGRPLLFIGQRATDGSSPDRPAKRPTSFQTPMVQCNTGIGVTPHYSFYSDHSTGPKTSSANTLCSSLILLLIVNIWCWNMFIQS
ncbi:protein APCDD1-like [Myxocyprinus asiaticus]|uniref:protein APCDD1-like n=1 Tax=Myxocyprinus asiaticus TaxID=70543 RepID=UPI002222321B|nr:protein APCDD1-like [Myxocyprinus asiaticus]